MNHFASKTVTSKRSALPLLYLLIVLLLACKSPDALSNAQFWAEDGTVFFAQQFGHALPQILVTYAGYLHAIPRLVAWCAQIAPYQHAPLLFNVFAILIDAAAILYFAYRMGTFVPLWITISIFALTPSGGEIFGTLTNVQWFLQFALFAAALLPQRLEERRFLPPWLAITLPTLVALTGPFSTLIAVVALPLAALAWMKGRMGWKCLAPAQEWWVQLDKRALGAVVAGGLIQALVMAFIGQRQPHGPFELSLAKQNVLQGFQYHTFGEILFSPSVATLFFVCLLLFLVRSAWRSDTAGIVPVALMLIFALLQIVSSAHAGPNENLISTTIIWSDRYFFFAKIAFWLCIACTLCNLDHSEGNSFAPVVLVLLILVAVLHPGDMRRVPLPDLNWAQESRALRGAGTSGPVSIPINPVPWRITVTPKEDTSH
ncbi:MULTISPECIES: hypothetical protein [unclassified Rhodanobacter]|uniref:Uncharacterized protein n=1 Tax=Rhodanobacter humi TaxID=1888173 RepID=A0ABV4AV44_9GAMM